MTPKKYLFMILTVAVLMMAVLIFAFVVYEITTPLSLTGEEKEFSVRSGDGFRDIADKLRAEGIIRNAQIFKVCVILKGWADKLKAGDYKLSPADSVLQIAQKIYEGEKNKEIRIVIPEGYNIFDIDKKLAEAGLINKGNLIGFNPNPALLRKYPFLDEIPENLPRHSALEGFLFPDTYNFFQTADKSLEPILAKFLDNFNAKISDDLKNETLKRGLNFYDVLKMASLLEKEISFFDERADAAGVLWKRLKTGMPLQVDATVFFIKKYLLSNFALNGEEPVKLLAQDYDVESFYNTYLYKGLPPAPICNPGLESIKAAIFYKDNNYWYYLSDLKTGKTIFAKTFEEHKKNKVKYLTN